jgi:hypothetical protein
LKPLYWLAEHVPAWSDGAQRLGLVTLNQMAATLADAVALPSMGVRVVEVPQIRRGIAARDAEFSSTAQG